MAKDTRKGPEETQDRSAGRAVAPRIAPGKVTRTSRLPGGGAVQRRALASTGGAAAPPRATREAGADSWMDAAHRGASASLAGEDAVQASGQPGAQDGAADPASIRGAAAEGIGGGGGALPYADRIQASFGAAHDVSRVRAHVGGAAARASEQMGAEAYATGEDVAFRGQPDLHTAAHVVQQRAGVQLSGGVAAPATRTSGTPTRWPTPWWRAARPRACWCR
jgi:Domain of unknown function (DUF4157)